MKAYLVQMDIVWRDKKANFRKVHDLLATQGVEPGGWVVLPEMFATGFDVEYGGLVEGTGLQLTETAAFLQDLAMQTGCVVQGSGITQGEGRKRRNVVVVYGPDGAYVQGYTKLHPFTYGGEHKRFESGSSIALYTAGDLRVSPFICYDLRFPEAFRHAMRAGAQVFTVVANWPRVRHDHWQALLRARAIENQAYVLGVNRCGRDQYLDYAGGSVAYDPRGRELTLAGESETVLTVDLNVNEVESWRAEFPVLGDAHSEFLGAL